MTNMRSFWVFMLPKTLVGQIDPCLPDNVIPDLAWNRVKNFNIPGNFKKFSRTLDIAWKWSLLVMNCLIVFFILRISVCIDELILIWIFFSTKHKIWYFLTLLSLTSYFYTKAWGGGEFTPTPLKIKLFLKKNKFYHHEVKFCINSALFWCIAFFSRSTLANFSNFIEKSAKFGIFQKNESYSSYIHQKKARMIQKLIPR